MLWMQLLFWSYSRNMFGLNYFFFFSSNYNLLMHCKPKIIVSNWFLSQCFSFNAICFKEALMHFLSPEWHFFQCIHVFEVTIVHSVTNSVKWESNLNEKFLAKKKEIRLIIAFTYSWKLKMLFFRQQSTIFEFVFPIQYSGDPKYF